MIGKQDLGAKASRPFNESTQAAGTPFGAFAGFMVWLLIGLFAIMSMFCVIGGAEVYRGAVKNADVNANLRTAVSYVAGKVRAWDKRGAVAIQPWEQGKALALTEEIDGEEYTTCIYGWDGGIWEIFAPSGSVFSPEDGQRIADGEALDFTFLTPGLIEMNITVNGAVCTSHVALRSAAATVLGG